MCEEVGDGVLSLNPQQVITCAEDGVILPKTAPTDMKHCHVTKGVLYGCSK